MRFLHVSLAVPWSVVGAFVCLGACSDSSSTPTTPDGPPVIFGADAPAIRIDSPFVEPPRFDARVIDARPPADSPLFDAFVGARFDVVYVSEWTLGAGAHDFNDDNLAVFVNSGSTNLNMRDLTILSVTDDNAGAEFRYRLDSAPDEDRVIAPGTSYGADGNQHVMGLIDPLVPEPLDSRVPTVDVNGGFGAVPGGTYDIHPKVLVQIGQQVAELDFLIHVTGSGTPVTFNKATRISSVMELPDAGVFDAGTSKR